MKPTILAVPSGSLQAKTLNLLTKSGIIRSSDIGRKYEIVTDYPGLVLRVLDRRDMPQCVSENMADFGLTGMDYLIESGLEDHMEILGELNFSRASNGPTQFVLAGPGDIFSALDDVRGKTIYTEFPRLTEIKLREKGFDTTDLDIRRTEGKTETWGIFGRSAFTDITETGETLRKNRMTILAELFQSRPNFFALKGTVTDLMKNVVYLLQRTLEQEQNPKVMVEMNVPRSSLHEVKAVISAETSPTVMNTADINTVVVKVLVPRLELIARVGALRALGVTGIAEIEVTSVF